MFWQHELQRWSLMNTPRKKGTTREKQTKRGNILAYSRLLDYSSLLDYSTFDADHSQNILRETNSEKQKKETPARSLTPSSVPTSSSTSVYVDRYPCSFLPMTRSSAFYSWTLTGVKAILSIGRIHTTVIHDIDWFMTNPNICLVIYEVHIY